MTRKLIMLAALSVVFSWCVGTSHAETTTVEKKYRLLGVIFELEKVRDDALADIQMYDAAIQEADDIVSRSENIMSLARKKGHAVAEQVARDALTKAHEAKTKNKKLKQLSESRKKQAEIAISNVYALLAGQSSTEKSEISSVVTGYSGTVRVYSKKRDRIVRLGEGDDAACLEPGDVIWTARNSSVEMQFLDGRGTVKIGEHSRLRVEEDGTGSQTLNLIKGKIHTTVAKLDEYRKMFEGKLRTYKEMENPATPKDVLIHDIAAEYYKKKDRWKKVKSGEYQPMGFWGPLGSAPLIRTATVAVAVRGTEFVVFEQEGAGTEIIVLEGAVEVRAIKKGGSVSVTSGYAIRVAKEGAISNPEKIDPLKFDRWWER